MYPKAPKGGKIFKFLMFIELSASTVKVAETPSSHVERAISVPFLKSVLSIKPRKYAYLHQSFNNLHT